MKRSMKKIKGNAKRLTAAAATVGMAVSMMTPVWAATWDIGMGSITISATEEGQFVSQGEIVNQKEEDETIVTGTSTGGKLTIEAEKGQTADVTLDDLTIKATGGQSAITIKGEGDVNLELDGKNEIKGNVNHAALEKNDSESQGTLTIDDANEDGGSLKAEGESNGAGIGGSKGESTSDIVINGGKITATSDERAAGIGGGQNGSGTVTINGGEITAISGGYGAGIGGGEGGNGTVTITGGTIKNAEGGGIYGAGIGGGNYGNGEVTISGGTIENAKSNSHGAGIGGGNQGDGTVTITGGKIENAQGGIGGAGIGGGYNKNGTVTIEGGEVNAAGGQDAAGIGGGSGIDSGPIGNGSGGGAILGGNVTATAGANGDPGWSTDAEAIGMGGYFVRKDEAKHPQNTFELKGGTFVEQANGSLNETHKTHNFSEGVTDGCKTVYTCSLEGCTATKTVYAHNIVEGDVTTEPTCTTPGEQYTYCDKDDCGFEKYETLEKLGHDWDEGVVTTEPTCITTGVKTYTCAHGCGTPRTETVAIDPTAHAWDEGVVTTAPTVTAEGERTYTCTHGCGAVKTESIPRLDPPDEPEENKPVLDVKVDIVVTAPEGNLAQFEQSVEKKVEQGTEERRVVFNTPEEDAVLTGSLDALAELKEQGVEKIVFRTPKEEIEISIDWLLAQGLKGKAFVLRFVDGQMVLMVDGRIVKL